MRVRVLKSRLVKGFLLLTLGRLFDIQIITRTVRMTLNRKNPSNKINSILFGEISILKMAYVERRFTSSGLKMLKLLALILMQKVGFYFSFASDPGHAFERRTIEASPHQMLDTFAASSDIQQNHLPIRIHAVHVA
mmetsp:Transcript_5166/g.6521  ORF Transcript_5166/g.6521 Transcript_5166/m.6521 type:complete len:136 (+) Transcript_5166:530-937(+)